MLEGLAKVDAAPFNEFASKCLPAALAGEGNECFSPLSLYLALSSVALGSDGEGQRELLDVHGVSSASALKRSCQSAYRLLCPPPPKPRREPKDERKRSLFLDDDPERIIIANALWVNERDGYSASGKYSRMFEKVMNGQARSVDFDDVAGEIADWASLTSRL